MANKRFSVLLSPESFALFMATAVRYFGDLSYASQAKDALQEWMDFRKKLVLALPQLLRPFADEDQIFLSQTPQRHVVPAVQIFLDENEQKTLRQISREIGWADMLPGQILSRALREWTDIRQCAFIHNLTIEEIIKKIEAEGIAAVPRKRSLAICFHRPPANTEQEMIMQDIMFASGVEALQKYCARRGAVYLCLPNDPQDQKKKGQFSWRYFPEDQEEGHKDGHFTKSDPHQLQGVYHELFTNLSVPIDSLILLSADCFLSSTAHIMENVEAQIENAAAVFLRASDDALSVLALGRIVFSIMPHLFTEIGTDLSLTNLDAAFEKCRLGRIPAQPLSYSGHSMPGFPDLIAFAEAYHRESLARGI